MDVKIEKTWQTVLQSEFDKTYFAAVAAFLHSEIRAGKIIYPPGKLIFNAFNSCPYDKVKVVLLGQDPYFGPGQAHGLSFSVPEGITPPPSLQNIFKELHADTGLPIPRHGCLEAWAGQGVLLLNSVLTVERGRPTSHSKIGWTIFTDAVIKILSDNKSGLVFLLWGNFAKSKRTLINTDKHFILEAAHPSPLARSGFLGSRPFSRTNALLEREGLVPIDWRL